MPSYGAIYIAHNQKDGLNTYKVGKTERDIASRMAELTADTTNLGVYSACAYFVVFDIDAAEQACHRRLNQYRVQENREFFTLELSRLLPLVREVVHPFLAQSFVPEIVATDEVSREHCRMPLSERLKAQREGMAKAVEAMRSREEQAKAELTATITRWEEELKSKITVVREAFADLPFIRWETPDPRFASSGTKAIAELLLHSAWKGERLRLKLRALVRKEDPPRPGAVRSESGTYMFETWEELDDGRVAMLLLTIPGEGFVGWGRIRVAALGIRYKESGSWEQTTQGEAFCSSPDEAIDLLSALISEYAANPITEGRRLGTCQQE